MKLLALVSTALSLSSIVQSVPIDEQGQTTPAQAIQYTFEDIQVSASQSEASIRTAVQNAKNNITAAATVAVLVGANLQAIVVSFQDAATQIESDIEQAGGGAGGEVQALTKTELDALTSVLNAIRIILNGISAIFYFEATNLAPQAEATVAAEEDQVKAAIAPLLNPVMIFISAASKASAKAGAEITGLQAAYDGALKAVRAFAIANGLPGISIPGYGIPLTE